MKCMCLPHQHRGHQFDSCPHAASVLTPLAARDITACTYAAAHAPASALLQLAAAPALCRNLFLFFSLSVSLSLSLSLSTLSFP